MHMTCVATASARMCSATLFPLERHASIVVRDVHNAEHIDTLSGVLASLQAEGGKHPCVCSHADSVEPYISACSPTGSLITTVSVTCSAYVLGLKNVVRYLFGDLAFARFAGTRLQGLMDSPLFQDVDAAHGFALTRLVQEQPAADAADECAADDAPELQQHFPHEHGESDRWPANTPSQEESQQNRPDGWDTESELGVADAPEPSDEIHTGLGDRLCLLFALFVDGVQLHQHGRATTTVISIKCLDLPGFLSNTKLASFNIAFISGPKEPTNLTALMDIILQQFKDHEPLGCTVNGCPAVKGSGIRVWDPYRKVVREVFPILFFAVADTPARKCLLLTSSHNCRSGCDKCGIRAGRTLPSGDVTSSQAFAGYGRKTQAVEYSADTQVTVPPMTMCVLA